MMEEAIALGKFISYIVYSMAFVYFIICLIVSDNIKEEIFKLTPHRKQILFSALIGAIILYFLFCMAIPFPAWYLICLMWFSY